jgi:hypothetical protein
MKKIAIFVEGQTELIFTRELLLKCYEWQNIWVECYSLFNDRDLNPVEYSFPNQDAEFYYQIINIGNDTKVLSSLLKREKYLFSANQAFDKIIGLRDMYSKEYRETAKSSIIKDEINQKFINSHNATIERFSENPDKVNFHFAIMELETWLLGINGIFSDFNEELTTEKIEEELEVNLEEIDPEKEVFHPAKLISEIMSLVNESYDKKKGEVNKFMGRISKEDFNILFESNKCETFNQFCNSLEINTTPNRVGNGEPK